MVIGHTDCGLQSVDDKEIKTLLVEALCEREEAQDKGDGDGGKKEDKENFIAGGLDVLRGMEFGSFVS